MKWLTVHRTNQNERSKCTTSAAIEGLTPVHLQHRSTHSHKAQTHQHLTCVSEQSAAHTAPASAWMLFITTSYSLKFPSGSKISHVPALCILVRRGGFSLVRWKEIVGVQEESGRVEKTDCDQQRVNLLHRRLKCFCQMSSDRVNIELALAAEADGVFPTCTSTPRFYHGGDWGQGIVVKFNQIWSDLLVDGSIFSVVRYF